MRATRRLLVAATAGAAAATAGCISAAGGLSPEVGTRVSAATAPAAPAAGGCCSMAASARASAEAARARASAEAAHARRAAARRGVAGRAPSARPPRPVLVVRIGAATVLRAAPGGRAIATLSPTTPFGSPTFVPAVRRRDGWLAVLAPVVGNGRVGWIPAGGLHGFRSRWAITVSLRRRAATVLHDGRVAWRFPVAVGRPGTPTPTGLFGVTDRLLMRGPSPYGCCVLALSARQDRRLEGWSGGDRIAFHGTAATQTIGQAASLGCLRAGTPDIRRLVADVPLGSPVRIVA